MSGGRGAGESRVWRKVIAVVRLGEMPHPQNKFRILSVEILSQQRDISSYIWISAHFLPHSVMFMEAGYVFQFYRKNKMQSIFCGCDRKTV